MTGWKARLAAITRPYFGFALPSFVGRGIFQRQFGLIPARCPLNVVVGDPIECPKIEHPSDEQVDEVCFKYRKYLHLLHLFLVMDLHLFQIQTKYCDALLEMFDEMKLKYVKDPEKETLRFVH